MARQAPITTDDATATPQGALKPEPHGCAECRITRHSTPPEAGA